MMESSSKSQLALQIKIEVSNEGDRNDTKEEIENIDDLTGNETTEDNGIGETITRVTGAEASAISDPDSKGPEVNNTETRRDTTEVNEDSGEETEVQDEGEEEENSTDDELIANTHKISFTEKLTNENEKDDTESTFQTVPTKKSNNSNIKLTLKKRKATNLDCVLSSIKQRKKSYKSSSSKGKQAQQLSKQSDVEQELEAVERIVCDIGADLKTIDRDVIRRNLILLDEAMNSITDEDRIMNDIEPTSNLGPVSLSREDIEEVEETVEEDDYPNWEPVEQANENNRSSRRKSNGSSSPKKERHSSYTFEFKMAAIQRVLEGGESRHQVARTLGIDNSLVRRWCKNKTFIESMATERGGVNAQAVRRGGSGRKAASEKLDTMVLDWILENRANNVHVSHTKISEKAQQIYYSNEDVQAEVHRHSSSSIGNSSSNPKLRNRLFTASKGWVNNFLRRHQESLKKT